MSDEGDIQGDRVVKRRFGVRSLSRFGIGQRALKDSIAGLALEGIQLVGTFVFFALFSREIGPSDYGSFASMYALIGISLAIAHAGPGLALLQHGMEEGLPKVSSNFFTIYAVLMLGAAVIVIGFAPLVLPRLPLTTVALFTVAEVLGVALVQLTSSMRLIVLGFSATVPFQIIPVVVKVIAVVALYTTGNLTLARYGLVYCIACVIMGIGVFVWCTGRFGLPRRFGRIRKDHFKTTMTISSTIWVYNLHNSGDQLTMSANDLGADVGLYAAAYRLIGFVVIPINALVSSSYRKFVDPSEMSQHSQRAVKYTAATVLYSTVAAIVLFFAAPVVMPILVGDSFNGAITIVRWLAPLIVIRGLYHFPSNALVGLGYPGVRLMCIVVSASIAMVLYIVLIPHLSWKGAVIGSYTSDTVLAIAAWVMLGRLRDKPRLLSEPEVVDLDDDIPAV